MMTVSRSTVNAVSWQAKLVDLGLRALRAKQHGGSDEAFQRALAKARAKAKPVVAPKRVLDSVAVVEETAGGMPVFQLRPKAEEPLQRVFYLHGGSYTFEIAGPHWSFLHHLTRVVPAHVTVVIYPLAPESKASRTVPMVTDLLEQVVDASELPVTLMGDSAGGGLSLSVAEQLNARGKQPASIVLISPWLDVSMTNPRLADIDPHDSMLGIPGLASCGRLYAGELDVKDPLVSPVFGDLAGLAPIDVFSGTHDVLNVDAHLLVERAEQQGAVVRLHEEHGMPHVHPLISLMPEGRRARDEIVEKVRSARGTNLVD